MPYRAQHKRHQHGKQIVKEYCKEVDDKCNLYVPRIQEHIPCVEGIFVLRVQASKEMFRVRNQTSSLGEQTQYKKLQITTYRSMIIPRHIIRNGIHNK